MAMLGDTDGPTGFNDHAYQLTKPVLGQVKSCPGLDRNLNLRLENTIPWVTDHTLVLDPHFVLDPQFHHSPHPSNAPALPLVVVYRGLGPETNWETYGYDTAQWMIEQIVWSIPSAILDNIVFVVPNTWKEPPTFKDCLAEAEDVLCKANRRISAYCLCGFSRGGEPLYNHLGDKPWSIVGLIDPVVPGDVHALNKFDIHVLDNFAEQIRGVYELDVWGESKKRHAVFFDHLIDDLNADVVQQEVGTELPSKLIHKLMPSSFFSKYGPDFSELRQP